MAILLLTAFGLPVASPLLAMTRSGEDGVPSCCRRAGTHHCMAGMMGDAGASQASGSHDPVFRAPVEKCPCWPVANTSVHREIASPGQAEAIFAGLVSHPCGAAQVESMWRISRDRSRFKRGPPALLRA